MNGILAVPSVTVSPRDRMTAVLDALAFGLLPPLHCRACTDSLADRCDECAQKLADAADVNAGIDAVESAGTEAEALAAYDACLLGLVGAEGGAL